jgi:RNA polymerase sigma-70 factor, ECF subfamily
MRQIAAGDERAFAALYDATSPMIFGLLVRLLGDRTRAEEVAQEVYMQAWRSADSFDPSRGSAWSWLAVLARSRAVDRGRSETSYSRALEGLEVRPLEQPLGTRAEPADARAELGERRERVLLALDTLPPEQRSLVANAFLDGRTHREIAEDTGLPLGTVKSRIRAALDKLEPLLRPSLGEPQAGG